MHIVLKTTLSSCTPACRFRNIGIRGIAPPGGLVLIFAAEIEKLGPRHHAHRSTASDVQRLLKASCSRIRRWDDLQWRVVLFPRSRSRAKDMQLDQVRAFTLLSASCSARILISSRYPGQVSGGSSKIPTVMYYDSAGEHEVRRRRNFTPGERDERRG